MMIELRGATAEDVEAARREFVALTRAWGYDAEVVEEPPQVADDRPDEKGVDPVPVVALVLSIPSAALAVHDLVDRLRSRGRARELIDRADRLGARRIVVHVLPRAGGPVELATLTSDRLLELPDEEPDGHGAQPPP